MSKAVTTHEERPYGWMERQLAFKLLAAHALVDHEYFVALRDDPVAAAAQLHIHLTEADVDYLKNHVEWDRIERVLRPPEARNAGRHAGGLRDALHLDLVTNSW